MSQNNRQTIVENENGLYISWSKEASCGSIAAWGFNISWFGIIFFFFFLVDRKEAPVQLFFLLVFLTFGFQFLLNSLRGAFNTSHINIENKLLKVFSSPIPGKSIKLEVAIDRIEQFFVSEASREIDRKAFNFCVLNVKLNDGTNHIVINNPSIKKIELLELEDRLEKYLGIKDSPVKGEVDSVRFVQEEDKIKRHKQTTTDYHSAFANKNVGEDVLFEGVYQRIIYTNQYDWYNTHIDNQLQLLSPDSENTLLYIKQNKGLYELYLESKLELYRSNLIAFNDLEPQQIFEWEDVNYKLMDATEGHSYINNEEDHIQIQQWFYRSIDGKQTLRINRINNELQFHQGELYVKHYGIIKEEEGYLDLNISLKKRLNQTDESDIV